MVDIDGQLGEVKHLDFYPLPNSEVKTWKPLEMCVLKDETGQKIKYRAFHIIPSTDQGEQITGIGDTEEEAAKDVFYNLQLKLCELRKKDYAPMRGIISVSKTRAYLEAVLDMPIGHRPAANRKK